MTDIFIKNFIYIQYKGKENKPWLSPKYDNLVVINCRNSSIYISYRNYIQGTFIISLSKI